jgi:hypothetical protein
MADVAVLLAGWRQLYQSALLESDPAKVANRIVDARNAVLDRIEDLLTCSGPERQALNDAFRVLGKLRSTLSPHPDGQTSRFPYKTRVAENESEARDKNTRKAA